MLREHVGALGRRTKQPVRRSVLRGARRCTRRWRSAAPRSSTSSSPRPDLLPTHVERGARRARRRRHRDRRQLRRPARAARAAGEAQARSVGDRPGAGRCCNARAQRRRRSRSRARCSSATASCSASLLQRESQPAAVARAGARLPPARSARRDPRRALRRRLRRRAVRAPDAVGRLRAVRKTREDRRAGRAQRRRSAEPGRHPHARGARRRRSTRNRVLFQDGLPIAALEGGQLRAWPSRAWTRRR